MREQHDTKLLEQVISAQAERTQAPAREVKAASDRATQEVSARTHGEIAAADADAQKQLILAQGRRAVMVLLAVSTLVVAFGVAGWLILMALPEKVADTPVQPEPPAAIWPNMPAPSGNAVTDESIVTTNFTLFRETEMEIGGRKLFVVAGHHYNKGTDTQFENAWCYTNVIADGLNVKIELGDKLPNASPSIDPIPPATSSKTGVSTTHHRKLFNACPWLDGNPDLSQTGVRSNSYTFSGEVSTASVDALIMAVRNGATTINFASPGGSLEDAVRGFAALKAANVETVATGECASACSILFLAGHARSVTGHGTIGVHQWASVSSDAGEAEAQKLSGDLVALFKNAGVSEEFFIAGSQTPAEGMRWLTPAELNAWGVVTAGEVSG